MRALLRVYPEAAHKKDRNGRLRGARYFRQKKRTAANAYRRWPVHFSRSRRTDSIIACCYRSNSHSYVVSDYPEAASKKDRYGQTPLSLAEADMAEAMVNFLEARS